MIAIPGEVGDGTVTPGRGEFEVDILGSNASSTYSRLGERAMGLSAPRELLGLERSRCRFFRPLVWDLDEPGLSDVRGLAGDARYRTV